MSYHRPLLCRVPRDALSENLGSGTLLGSFDIRDDLETASKLARVQYFAAGQANETMLETESKRGSSPGRLFRPGTEVRYLRDEMRKIGRLTNEGSLAEAREACAALMFDFQAIIVGRPHLAWQFADLLGQCGAAGLSRRFQVAAGFSSGGVPRPARSVNSPRPTQSVAASSAPSRVFMGELATD